MPGVLSHWLVAREAALRLIRLEPDAAEIVRAPPVLAVENRVPEEYRNASGDREEHWARHEHEPLAGLSGFFGFDGGLSEYLYFGATLPDLGYYAPSEAGRIPARLSHERLSGELVLRMILRAKEHYWNASRRTPARRWQSCQQLAVALGHISHICADVLLHPDVHGIAGAPGRPAATDAAGQVRALARALERQGASGMQAPRRDHEPGLRVVAGLAARGGWLPGQGGDLHAVVEAHRDSWVAKHYFRRFQVDDAAESWTHFLERITSTVTPEEILEYGSERIWRAARDVLAAGGKLPAQAGRLGKLLLGPWGVLLGWAVKVAAMMARYRHVRRDVELDLRQWLHEHRSTGRRSPLTRLLRSFVIPSFLDTYGPGFAQPPGEGRPRLPFSLVDLESAVPIFHALLLGNAYDESICIPDNPFLPFVDAVPYRDGEESELHAVVEGRRSREMRRREAEMGRGYLARLLEAAELAAPILHAAVQLYDGRLEADEFRERLPDWNLVTGHRLEMGRGPGPGSPEDRSRVGEEVRVRLVSAAVEAPARTGSGSAPPGDDWAGAGTWRRLGRRLALDGAPILLQTLDDPYRPLSIESTVGHPGVRLLDREGEVVAPAGGAERYRPNVDLDPHRHGGEHVLDLGGVLADPAGVEDTPAVHVRLRRCLVLGAGGHVRGERIVAQYWLFFLHSQNLLPDGGMIPELKEGVTEHQGDWEFVQVIWRRDAASLAERDRWRWTEDERDRWRPEWVGCSIHYYGEGRPFGDLEEAGLVEGRRPLVYIAEGGHGSHFERGVVPAFSGMERKRATEPGVWGSPRSCDYTEASVRLRPEGVPGADGPFDETYRLIQLDDDEPWLDWPGHFGRPGGWTSTAVSGLRKLERVGSEKAWLVRMGLGYAMPSGPRGPKYRHPMEESLGRKRHAYALNMWAQPLDWQAEFSQPGYRNAPVPERIIVDARWVGRDRLRPLGETAPPEEEVLCRVRAAGLEPGDEVRVEVEGLPEGAAGSLRAEPAERLLGGRPMPGIYLARLPVGREALAGRRLRFRGRVLGRDAVTGRSPSIEFGAGPG